jgi:hypothetical protein
MDWIQIQDISMDYVLIQGYPSIWTLIPSWMDISWISIQIQVDRLLDHGSIPNPDDDFTNGNEGPTAGSTEITQFQWDVHTEPPFLIGHVEEIGKGGESIVYKV